MIALDWGSIRNLRGWGCIQEWGSIQADTVFHTYVAKGGKTATTSLPIGARAKDADNVAIPPSVGAPPPPIDPG